MNNNKFLPLIKKSCANIYILLGLVFLIRMLILYFLGKPYDTVHWNLWIRTGDTKSYIVFANEIYSGVIKSYPFRLPLYPIVMVITHSLFSLEWLGTILFHQIISLVTAWMIYKLILPYVKSAAIIASLIFLFEPASFIYSYLLLPETFMIFIQVAATIFIIKASSLKGIKKFGFVSLSSLVLCSGVFFKPVLIYSLALYIIFIFFYFKDSLTYKILYVLLFICLFQTPIHFYRQYLYNKFGVYSLTRQEYSEKAGRALDIKYVAEHGRIMHIDSLRAEIRRTLISGGFDYNHPDYVLYSHITDSISRTNLRKHPYAVAAHSFIDSYMFFQPATGTISDFLNITNYTKIPDHATFDEKITHIENRTSSLTNIVIIFISLMYSLILIVPFFISMINKNVRRMYSPLVYFAVMWFLYTSVAIGRIAQTRYRVTFIWTFAILAGLVYSYIKENGIKSIIPPFLKKDKLPEA